jgi:hypothetical protein
MTCPGFPATDPATAGIHRYLVVMGRVAPSELSEDESRYHFQNAFFHSTPSVLHIMLIDSLLVNRNDHAWAAGLCVWEAPPASAAKGAAAKRPLGGVLRVRDIWNAQRVQFSPAAAVGAAIPFLFTNKASAVESKRILTVHSFSGAAPPVAVHSFE